MQIKKMTGFIQLHHDQMKVSSRIKMHINSTLYLALFLSFFSSYTYADISVVVSNDNNNALNKFEIKKIFLGQRTFFPDGSQAIPVIQEKASETAQQFITLFLNRSLQQYRSHWARLIFTGKGYPPEEIFSDAEAIDRIINDPTIISYIQSSSLTEDVKEVLRIEYVF